MKALLFSIYVVMLAIACNNEDPMIDPICPTPPPDTKLMDIKNKWEGDYIGTVTHYKYHPTKPSTYDTLYNQKIIISDFKRDSVFSTLLYVLMVYNDSYIDSTYHGSEDALLSDSVELYKWPSLGGISNITLNHRDSTLVKHSSYAPSPDAGSVLQGYYKRQ